MDVKFNMELQIELQSLKVITQNNHTAQSKCGIYVVVFVTFDNSKITMRFYSQTGIKSRNLPFT